MNGRDWVLCAIVVTAVTVGLLVLSTMLEVAAKTQQEPLRVRIINNGRQAELERALRRVLDVDPPEVRFDVEYQRAVTAARITLGDWE